MRLAPPFPKRSLALRTGTLLALLPFGALADAAADDPDARIRALESIVQELRAEVQQLREQVNVTPTTPAPGVDASPGAEGAPPPRGELRDIEFDTGETRSRVTAIEGRLASQVPNVRLANGVILEDPAGRWSLRATGRMQFDYRSFDSSGAMADTFSVRRARTGLGLTIGKVFTAFIEAEHSLGTATQAGTSANGTLHQAYIDFTPAGPVKLRVGQFKPQFGLELTMATWQHDFQERSVAANLLQGTQNNVLFDRGFMLYGAPAAGVNYGFSVTNGTGTNLDEFQRAAPEAREHAKDYTLRITANAAAWTDAPDWVLHFGASYKSGNQDNYCPPTGTISATNPCGYRAPNAITEARSITFFNPRPFNVQGSATAPSSVQRTIQGLEAAIAWRNLKFQTEALKAAYSGEYVGGGGFDRDIEAGYFAANWLITGEYFARAYSNGVFGRIRPDNDFGAGPDSGWGALEAGLRFSYWDANEFASGPSTDISGVNGTNTSAPSVSQSTNRMNAWTVALKWMPTAYTAYMVNVVRTNFGTPVVANGVTIENETALTMRAQFDFY